MSRQPLRIGVTGSGFMGRTHVDAAARLEQTQPVAVAGGRRAAQLADDYQLALAADVHELVRRDDVDAVVIATPHHVHLTEALAAAEAGKHALVEKPLATSVADAERIVEAFRSRNLVLSVGYHQRFREGNLRTRQLIAEGAIGPVRCIQTSALFDISVMRKDQGFGGDWGWWRDPRSVAHLLNSGPHTIDLCRWWLNQEPTSVAAAGGTFREADNPNENTTMALLRFSQGAMATFWSSSVLPSPGFPGEAFRFRIMGDEGLIDLDPYDELRLGRGGKLETVYRQPPVQHDDSDAAFGPLRMAAYCEQLAAFVRTIGGEPGGEGTGFDGLQAVRTVLAMLQANASGESVFLDGAGKQQP